MCHCVSDCVYVYVSPASTSSNLALSLDVNAEQTNVAIVTYRPLLGGITIIAYILFIKRPAMHVLSHHLLAMQPQHH